MVGGKMEMLKWEDGAGGWKVVEMPKVPEQGVKEGETTMKGALPVEVCFFL